jgi:hypothetical protein
VARQTAPHVRRATEDRTRERKAKTEPHADSAEWNARERNALKRSERKRNVRKWFVLERRLRRQNARREMEQDEWKKTNGSR